MYFGCIEYKLFPRGAFSVHLCLMSEWPRERNCQSGGTLMDLHRLPEGISSNKSGSGWDSLFLGREMEMFSMEARRRLVLGFFFGLFVDDPLESFLVHC